MSCLTFDEVIKVLEGLDICEIGFNQFDTKIGLNDNDKIDIIQTV